MNKKTHNPQTASLMDFWNSQQERLSLLCGKTITEDVVKSSETSGITCGGTLDTILRGALDLQSCWF